MSNIKRFAGSSKQRVNSERLKILKGILKFKFLIALSLNFKPDFKP